MSMKEQVKGQGGYFLCAFKAKNGKQSSRCFVRAHNAREARRSIRKAMGGCALLAFVVKAVCP